MCKLTGVMWISVSKAGPGACQSEPVHWQHTPSLLTAAVHTEPQHSRLGMKHCSSKHGVLLVYLGRAALLLMSTSRLAVSASSLTLSRWYLQQHNPHRG
jgi:hypothetical protein